MSTKITHLHDTFIKDVLSHKESAIDFFKEYLPGSLVKALDLETLTPLGTSYINRHLKTSYSDLVWSVKMKDQENLQISMLLEHKSTADVDTAFQLLEYLALAYRKQRKEIKKTELIVPILYYHGKHDWEFRSMQSFFPDLPDFLKVYIPAFHTEYVNLHGFSAAQILELENGLLSGAIMLQKYFFYPEDLNTYFLNILEKLSPYLHTNLIEPIFVYLKYSGLDKEHFDEAIKNLPEDMRTRVLTLGEQFKVAGIAEGREQVLQKTVLNAFDNGYAVSEICLITGESEQKINQLLKQNNRIR